MFLTYSKVSKEIPAATQQGILLVSLISNHLYSQVKLHTYGSHSILMSNYILVVLTSRSVTHPHTAPPLACLTSPFLP
jgi:hypothetical protein